MPTSKPCPETAEQMGIEPTGAREYPRRWEVKAIKCVVPPEGRRPSPAVSRRCLSKAFAGKCPKSTGGAQYLMQILDDSTSYGWVVFLSEQYQCYRRRSVPCVVDKPLMAVTR